MTAIAATGKMGRMEKTYLSPEKRQELLVELEDLRSDKRRQIAERLEFAKSLGDLSENAEYHAAREEQADTEERINQLESILKNSEIITAHHSAKVEIGSTLLVKKPDGAETNFTIVGSEEADLPAGKISYLSPLGAALLGKKKSEEVLVATPRGEVRYKIIKIE